MLFVVSVCDLEMWINVKLRLCPGLYLLLKTLMQDGCCMYGVLLCILIVCIQKMNMTHAPS